MSEKFLKHYAQNIKYTLYLQKDIKFLTDALLLTIGLDIINLHFFMTMSKYFLLSKFL